MVVPQGPPGLEQGSVAATGYTGLGALEEGVVL